MKRGGNNNSLAFFVMSSLPMSALYPSLQADEAADPFMAGLTFHHIQKDDDAPEAQQIGELLKSVRRQGGSVATEYDPATVTHVVLESAGVGAPGSPDDEMHRRATRDRKRIVSWTWIEACVKAGALVPVDDSVLHLPVPSLDGLSDMADVRVCLTGYTGDRRAELISVVERLGAEYMRVLDRKSTHLVCYEFEGAKWAKANQTGLQRIVSHRWLEECLRRWAKVPEAPYSTRSGKEEDELAAAAAEDPEIPDSEDEEDDAALPDSEEQRARPAARENASLGTFVTELTAGMIPANDNDVVDAQAPATVLREVRSGSGSGNFGAETQEAGDALAALAPGSGGMAPPAPRAPRGGASQPTPGKNAAAPVDANPSMMMSPDWDALEARPSQHIERSARDWRMDPMMRDKLDGMERDEREAAIRALPAEMREFAGRVGSANDVEAAFGGRFMDRQPERWHRFNDGDAPLAADDFAAFLADIGSGSWEPNLNVDESSDWARGVLDGDVLFEIIAVQPKRCPAGMKVTRMPRLPNYIAHRDDEDEGDVSRWVKLAAEAERRKKVGPLGAAVISKLRLETSKQPETRGWDENKAPPRAGPNALLATFLEVYCPFGHSMSYDDLLGLLVEAEGTQLRLRDFKETVTLPKRYPGNLDGIYLMEVQRPLSEVVVGFHELLAGPTEPDLTQAAPSPRGAIVAPSSNKAWTLDVGARISIQACAPGSQAAMAAASSGWLNDEGGAAASAGNALGRRTTSSKKKQKTTSAAAAAAAAVPPASEEQEAIHRDLAAQLDECITQKQNEEEEEEEEEEVAVAGARRGRKKQAVLMTQETGDTGHAPLPEANREETVEEEEAAEEEEEEEVALPARRRRGGKEKATASVPEPAAERPRRGARGKPTEKAPAPAKTPKAKTPAKKSPAEAKTPAEKTPAEKTPAEKTPANKSPAEKPSAKSKTPASKSKNASASKSRSRATPAAAVPARTPAPAPSTDRPPRVALSGFGSADLTKYGATVSRLGGSLCAGHAWDARATLVVFGPRGSRSIKFLAAAAAGVPLLDMSYLDASRRAGKFLGPESFVEHLWKGGWRGADMGLVSPDAAARWLAAGARPFEGLTVAMAPFTSANRVERDMLTTVLKSGGASVASISAKGEVVPSSPKPDVAVVDPGSMAGSEGKPSVSGRAAAAAAAVAGGTCVSPEFFKSWLSRPGTDLSQHVLRGKLAGKLAKARGGAAEPSRSAPCPDAREEENGEENDEPKAPPAKKSRSKTPATKTPATKTPATKSAGKTASGSKRSPAVDRPAPIVGKRRRVLAARN